jgi:hypothetical protein
MTRNIIKKKIKENIALIVRKEKRYDKMILDYKYPFFSSLKPTTIEKRGGVFSSLFTKHLRENPTN